MHSTTGCPANYAELFSTYFDRIKAIVARSGIKSENVEDVAMDILTRFMENDGLDRYDANMVHDVTTLSWNGQKVGRVITEGERYRTASFWGMLRQYVCLSVRHHLDRQNSQVRHEPIHLEQAACREADEAELTWAEVHADNIPSIPDLPTEDTVDVMDAIDSAHRLRELRVVEAVETHDHMVARAVNLKGRSRQKALLEARRAARRSVEQAERRERALFVAARIAAEGGRVTGSAVAKECGWSPQIGVVALREAKDDLKTAGL